jgi:hypothetical protein
MTERESEKLLKEEDKIKRAFVDHTGQKFVLKNRGEYSRLCQNL